MMKGRYNFLTILTFFVINHRNAYSKWIKGTLQSQSNWEFLTRFCFLTQSGALYYEFKYPVKYGTQEILLYYDEPGQWDFVYRPGKNCSERKSVLPINSNQIIALNNSNTKTSLYSGCQLVSTQGDNWYHCQGQRGFRSSRERWWYMAVARCEAPKGQVTGLYLQYKLHMTNGDDLLYKEFSADEFYILPVDIAFFIVYLIMSMLSVLCAGLLRSKSLFHTTYKMYLVALFIWTFHLFLMVIAWGYYGNTGFEQGSLEVTGRVMQTASRAIFVLMLILMAKGYTITRGRLTRSSKIRITVFFLVYILVTIVLFIWEGMFFDPGKVLYYYESPPGYGLIAMLFIAWLWFLYATAFTMKNSKTKVQFFIPFFGFYTFWFLAGPLVALIAMFALAKWSREKTVNGVEQFVSFVGHVVFLVLTRPSAANSNFPYHIRTSQIAALASNEDRMSAASNAYIVSSGVVYTGSGPNLDFFITSKNLEPTDCGDGHVMYTPPEVNSSRSNVASPSSYPQSGNNEMDLPYVTGGYAHSSNYFSQRNDSNGNHIGSAGVSFLAPTAPVEEVIHFSLKDIRPSLPQHL